MKYKQLLIENCKTMQEVVEFSCRKANNNRSSHRTNILNDGIVSSIMRHLPDSVNWKYEKEQKIKCARANNDNKGKCFSIDVILSHKQTGVKIYILLKAIEASYNKNSNNFANTKMGEVERIYGHSPFYGNTLSDERKNDLTLFLTLLPGQVPVGNKIENTKRSASSNENLRLFNDNIHQVTIVLDNKLTVEGKNVNRQCAKQELLSSLTNSKVKNKEEVIESYGEFFRNVEQVLRI